MVLRTNLLRGSIMAEEEFKVAFKPLGESKEIILTPSIVNQYLTVKSARGIGATPADVRKFLEMCAAQALNPWLGDAFLIGYDNYDKAGNHTGATFSLVTSHQAILKRAEASPQYDGMKSGVVALPKKIADQIGETGVPPEGFEKLIQRREGDLLFPWETVIGGWAEVKRKDREFLSSDVLEFEVYTTGRSRWLKDPAGMIVKCAEASAQRKAFPSTLGALYIQEEMESVREGRREHALTDQREEQAANRIVIPAEAIKVEPVLETVSVGPGAVQGPATTSNNVQATEERERALEPSEARETRQESVWPEAIENLLGAARRAKSEMSLLSVQQGWFQIKANYPEEMVAEVDKFFARRKTEVAPAGK